MRLSKSLFIFLLKICLFDLALTQTIKEVQIGDSIKGSMALDESHQYFVLTIPKNESNRVLIFNTHEDSEEYVNTDEKFSDPDFYISKINKYPSSKRTSEWFSERYGSDLLSIAPESVVSGDKFYIGMYCQFKCRYYLHIYTDIETEIKTGEFNYLNIKPQETMNYKLNIDKDFEELKVIVYSKTSGKFRIFMNKNGPSSQNTFNIIPSWTNGYTVSVRKEEKEEYCVNCTYHIIIQNEGNEQINSLMLYAYFQDKILDLAPSLPLYDAIDPNSKRCYSFKISNSEKNQKLIIQLTLYSGHFIFFIEGWEPQNIANRESLFQKKYAYKIVSNIFYILGKEDFDYFDELKPEYKGKDSNLFFCIYSHPETSYIITTYFLSQIEKIQEFEGVNVLTPGSKIRSYLLKDQVIKYELTGLNLEKKNLETNVTVITNLVVGNVSTYGYFCTKENCTIKREEIQNLKKENKLINSIKDDFETNILKIDYKDNICNKNPTISTEKGVIKCLPLILLRCDSPSEDGFCIFDLRLIVQDLPMMMQPKQMYYGAIPLGKSDKYKISITDQNVHSLVVVLDSESGDAELLVFSIEQTNNRKVLNLVRCSCNNDYIPDVARLTPKLLNKQNLVGDYLVQIVASSFSTYHIYYYVIYNKEKDSKNNEKDLSPEVTMNLEVGETITDFFPGDIRYKIYSFTPLLNKKSDLKIFMNKVNIDFSLYIYKDITKFSILQPYDIARFPEKEIISGYDWKSDGNNEIYMESSDPKYSLNKMYYIIIAPNLPKPTGGEVPNNGRFHMQVYDIREKLDLKTVVQFYLGISEVNTPIAIKEGVPHSFTLNNNYNGQKYIYTHTDINRNFELHIDVKYGEIDVFINSKEIEEDTVKNIEGLNNKEAQGVIQYKLNIQSNEIITINPDFFKKNSVSNSNGFDLYFYIKRSKNSINENKECQYVLVEKSSLSKGEVLQPGEVRTSQLKIGRSDHYIIEEVQKRDGGVINVIFKNGYGNIYVRIPDNPEPKNIRYPDASNHDYTGEPIYSGRIVQIPKEIYSKLDSKKIMLQILITVEAESGSDEDNPDKKTISSESSYSISYSNEPKKINQNEPYDGYIGMGELQYFTFYFDETTENIFIGLSNMNGDADLYLNYGKSLPTPFLNNWKTTETKGHEYIDLNIKDEFFKKNKISSLSGFYTLLIVGYTDTSYTVFVSEHDNVVFPLRNNRPMTCLCQNADDKCYYRFNDVFELDNNRKGIENNEIVFTTKYLYGNGIMYSKVFKDSELYGNEFYKLFPSENNYEMSNKESKQRNYMKMKIEGKTYTKDSTILLTFVCSEKTQVDITATSLRHFKSIDYMMENRENIYYLGYNNNSKEQPELDIYFYNSYKDQDFIYGIHSYVGDAHVQVFTNDSHWDINQQKVVYDFHLFKEFEILSLNYEDNKNNIDVYNPYSKDYHNFISKKEKEKYENIIFRVIPKSIFGFYIQGNFEQSWNNIPFGKTKNYFAKNNEFYGYFDISEEYSDIEFNLNIDNNLKMSAVVYIKINVIDSTKKVVLKKEESSDEFKLYHYSIPNPKNYDYKMKTDKTLGTISININNLPKLTAKENEYKFVRGLFYVVINKDQFEPLPDIEQEIEKKSPETQSINKIDEQQLITILLTPGIKYYKYVDANPYEYYFSNLTYNKNEIKKSPETKIYALTRESPAHDLMIIEISSCTGQYEIKLQDQLMTKDTGISTIDFYETKKNGKHTIAVNNLKSKHIYLSVTAKTSDFICSIRNHGKLDPSNCGNNLSYLMYYYTTNKKNLFFSDFDKIIINKPYGIGKIKIYLPKAIMKDIYKQTKEITDFKFDVFASKDESYFEKMGSVCYLSRFKSNTSTIYNLENIKVENKNALIVSGLNYRSKYYINILAQNTKTRELIAFKPMVVWSGGYLPFEIWKIACVVTSIILLIILLVIFIAKYRCAKKELKEIKGDTLPKTEVELTGSQEKNNIRYSGLGESY